MSKHSEACAAHAARCIEVAAKTSSAEDRREFLSFAAAWEQLATEVEQTERLAAFLDGLGTAEEAAIEANGEPMSSHAGAVRRLARAITAITDDVARDTTAHHLSLLLKR
jgi:hypothetical protein